MNYDAETKSRYGAWSSSLFVNPSFRHRRIFHCYSHGEMETSYQDATIILPVTVSLAAALGMEPKGLMIAAAMASSLAFMLPVATPPNAIVFGTGYITIPQMARAGVWMNILCIVIITLFITFILR